MKRVLLFFIIPVFLGGLSSCEAIFGSEPNFEVYTNSPVAHGEPLELGYVEKDDDYSYYILLPDGREYDGYELSVDKADFSHAGEYQLMAVGKNTFRQRIFVEVIPANIDCSLNEDSLTSSNIANLNMGFSYVGGSDRFGDYRVSANSSTGDLNLTFYGSEKPTGDRTYNSDNGSFPTEASVKVETILFSTYGVGGQGQPVHVYELNGKTHIMLCDFEINTSSPGISPMIDAHLVLD